MPKLNFGEEHDHANTLAKIYWRIFRETHGDNVVVQMTVTDPRNPVIRGVNRSEYILHQTDRLPPSPMAGEFVVCVIKGNRHKFVTCDRPRENEDLPDPPYEYLDRPAARTPSVN